MKAWDCKILKCSGWHWKDTGISKHNGKPRRWKKLTQDCVKSQSFPLWTLKL